MNPERSNQNQPRSAGHHRTGGWLDRVGPIIFWPLLAISMILLLQRIAGGPLRVTFKLDPVLFSKKDGHVVSASLSDKIAPSPGHLAFAVVTEDGYSLHLPVRARSLIEKRGLGRYLFRSRTVYFSSTDNSDPATNGRSYQAVVPRKVSTTWVIVFWAAAAVLGVTLLRRYGFRIPPWKPASSSAAPGVESPAGRAPLLAFRISSVVLAGFILWGGLLLLPASTMPLFRSLPFINEWTWKVAAFVSFITLCWAAVTPLSSRPDAACRVSEIVFQLLAVLVLVLLRLPGCFLNESNPDEGDWIVGANVLARDPRFWISYDGVTSGPLVVFPLLLIKLAGAQVDYFTAKLFVLVLSIAITSLFYRTVATLFDSRVARLGLLPLVFAVGTMSHYEFVGYNGEYVPILLLALAIFLFARLTTAAGGRWRAFFLGVALGSIPYAKLQAAPMALLLACAAGVHLLLRKDRRLAALVAGGIAPSMLLLIYLTIAVAFDEFLRAYLGYNLDYSMQFAGKTAFLDGLRQTTSLITESSGNLRFFFFAWLTATGLGLGWIAAARRRIPVKRFIWPVFAFLLLATALYCVYKPLRPFTHYVLFLVLPGALLIAVLIGLAVSYSRRRLTLVAIAVTVTAGLPLVLSLYCDRHGALAFPAPIAIPLGVGTSPIAEEIRRHAGPGERMAIWGWASRYYIQSGLLPATRVPVNSRQTNLGRYQEYYIKEYVRDLETNRPKIFLELDPKHPLSDYLKIADYVAAHFHPVAKVGGAVIHVRNDP